MITYENFWITVKEKGETWYSLTKHHRLSDSLLYRLKHDLPINTVTIDRLCNILDCNLTDILTYQKETESTNTKNTEPTKAKKTSSTKTKEAKSTNTKKAKPASTKKTISANIKKLESAESVPTDSSIE